ncbi:MAG: hypothetical protein ACYC1P_06245 [Gaiellaceae bacterium]
MTKKILLGTALATVAAAASFTVALNHGGNEVADERTIVVASSSYRWPSATLRDWADFADQVAVLEVVSEEALPPSVAVLENDEGMIGRRVTARVESTVWRNPGSPSVSGTVQFTTWGWAVHEGQRIPMVDTDSIRVEVGDRLLAPLLRAPEGVWAALSPAAVLQLDGDIVVVAPQQTHSIPGIASALHRKASGEAGRLLAETAPRANAASLRRLNADARVAALAREQ